MKLVNKTHYDSNSLLEVFDKCMELISHGSEVKKVYVQYHRSILGKNIQWCGGFAPVIGKWIVIKIPKDNWNTNTHIGHMEFKSQVLACVFIHELGHLMKVKHQQGMTIEYQYMDEIEQIFNDTDFPI